MRVGYVNILSHILILRKETRNIRPNPAYPCPNPEVPPIVCPEYVGVVGCMLHVTLVNVTCHHASGCVVGQSRPVWWIQPVNAEYVARNPSGVRRYRR